MDIITQKAVELSKLDFLKRRFSILQWRIRGTDCHIFLDTEGNVEYWKFSELGKFKKLSLDEVFSELDSETKRKFLFNLELLR